MKNITKEQVEAGQAVYTKRTLNAYDIVVLGVSNRWIWKCPTDQLEAHYNQHLSANHLDVGVGTGYFLDRCHFPSPNPRVGLMDLNVDALGFAAHRIARYHPEKYQANVLEPIPFAGPKFDSIGVNYLLHCLPGSMESKAVVFDHLKALMNPNAVIFGSTLLQEGVDRGYFAQHLMSFYNKKRIFSNQEDSLERLKLELNRRFQWVNLRVIGCVAVFAARVETARSTSES
jgi:2-polyprenyl-3-methyl-5-hydroxy-6-metoxy-1,4-benzoquinol methylase